MLYFDIAAMLGDTSKHGLDLGVKQRITLTVEFDHRQERKNRFRNRFKFPDRHVPAADAGLIQKFLTAADLTAQIALVRKRQVRNERRGYCCRAAREKGVGPGVGAR